MQTALKPKQQPRRSGTRGAMPTKEEAESLLREGGGGGSCSGGSPPHPVGDAGEGEGPTLHWRDAVAAARSAEGEPSQPLTDTFGCSPFCTLHLFKFLN